MWEKRRADGSLKLKINAIPTLFDKTGNLFFYIDFYDIRKKLNN